MRYKISALVVAAAALVAAAPLRAPSAPPPQDVQNEEELTRGAYFDSRPEVQTPKPKKPKTKPVVKSDGQMSGGMPRPHPAPPPPPVVGPNQNPKPAKPAAHQGGKDLPAAPTRIGLGYTLFMRDSSGEPVRVDPSREFVTGDQIRLVIEPNTDGYLYIFSTENGTNPEMLYPLELINCGQNRIYAHMLYEIPFGRWWRFDGATGTGSLYVVVARAPLADVPSGEALLKYCEEVEGDCEWKPPAAVWAWIRQRAATETALVSRSTETVGKALSAGEEAAVTRGLTLSKSDPAPSVIRLNASPSAGVHVTTINLVHK